jgi:hypothetical protein
MTEYTKEILIQNYTDPCPNCGFDLDGGDVYESLRKHYPDYTEEKAKDIASAYGWSEENKKRSSKKVGIYDIDSDATIFYACPKCKAVFK